MLSRPAFNPSFRVQVSDSDGVFLLSERGSFVLKSKIYRRLARLIDGRHTCDDIVKKVASETEAPNVYYALGLLESKGYILEAGDPHYVDRQASWCALGVSPPLAEERLKQTVVSVVQFGKIPIDPLLAALAAMDIRVGKPGDFVIVLTPDYLNEALSDFNTSALESRRPWLLAKPIGTVCWLGPLFRPGTTACWECLAQRLRMNREVESFLEKNNQATTTLTLPAISFSAVTRTGFELTALEIAKRIVCDKKYSADCTLTTIDLLSLTTQKHVVVQRPQCSRCGNRVESPSAPSPISLCNQTKRFTTDGGHRVASPAETISKYEHHVSSITGAVTVLARASADDDCFKHVYIAGHNLAFERRDLHSLRRGLRCYSGGKGMTDLQAKASGLCEALERYSGNFHGDEFKKRATYRQLGATAIHPDDCMLFSKDQYLYRRKRNTWDSRCEAVPVPLDEEAEIDWTPIWSLTRREFRYLPTGLCYYGYRMLPSSQYFLPDSNGCAAGNTLEEAILQGFLELVERDGVCLWWYNRVSRPQVDLESFEEPYILGLRENYRALNRELWALDLTSDLGIPTFAAISPYVEKGPEKILLGFGAHLDPKIGLLRAITELNQFVVTSSNLDKHDEDVPIDMALENWWSNATLANQPYLNPAKTSSLTRSDYERIWTDDVRKDIEFCRQVIEERGLELLVLDQTRPDIGLPVAKVFAPGLRHFWRRLAPGRLYDVPVKLGWIDKPLAENELNPVSMFV